MLGRQCQGSITAIITGFNREGPIQNTSIKNVKRPIAVVSVDQLLPYAQGSTFSLMKVAMVRSLELASGQPPLVDNVPLGKTTSIVFEEIAQGKVAMRVKDSHRKGKEPEKR